jgi:hypothetical protein
MPYGYNGFLNPYVMIIVILIVLQWFRVGHNGNGIGPENGLLACGGLFIIALFLLVYCACGNQTPIAPVAAAAASRCNWC